MPLIDRPSVVSEKQLRQFGWINAFALPALGWWFGLELGWVLSIGVLSMGYAGLTMWRPEAIKPWFLGLSWLTYPIGLVMSELLLLSVFYLAVTPIGLLVRCFGHDRLELKWKPDKSSHWQARPSQPEPKRYWRRS
jgi:hypothetical protein